MARQNSQMRSEVAIVVPCYNVEPYLQRALDSVYAQSYRDFHICCVDDGSTDGTLQVLKTNARSCTFVCQPHAGPAAARNRAIRVSDSAFVAFLDADDKWMPSKLERQITMLKQDPTLGLVCSLCLVSELGNERRAAFSADGVPGCGRLFQDLVRNCFVFTPTVVVRRRCLEEVGLFNEALPVSEDFNLWLRIAARWKIALLPETLAITHKRPGSLSASIAPEERLRAGVVALEHVQSSCPELSPSDRRALRRALAERMYFHGSFLLSTGAQGLARQKLLGALKHRPTHWRAIAKLGLTFLPLHVTDALVQLKSMVWWRPKPEDPAAFAARNAPSP